MSLLAANRWPFRLHATYDESIARFLTVFEEVNREVPLKGLNWFFDHCETISDRNLERVKALGGGIAIQHRMAYQGEYFMDRYGKEAAERTPPVRRMLDLGIPVGAGTDATRVASYNPWVSLSWLVTGRTTGGASMYPESNVSAARKRCGFTHRGAVGFLVRAERKARLLLDNWPIWLRSPMTTFPFQKSASKAFSLSLRLLAGRLFTPRRNLPPTPHLPFQCCQSGLL